MLIASEFMSDKHRLPEQSQGQSILRTPQSARRRIAPSVSTELILIDLNNRCNKWKKTNKMKEKERVKKKEEEEEKGGPPRANFD